MQDKHLEDYKNPIRRNEDYIKFCDKKVNANITENGTYRYYNNGNDVDTNLFDMELENPLNSIRSSFYEDFNNSVYFS